MSGWHDRPLACCVCETRCHAINPIGSSPLQAHSENNEYQRKDLNVKWAATCIWQQMQPVRHYDKLIISCPRPHLDRMLLYPEDPMVLTLPLCLSHMQPAGSRCEVISGSPQLQKLSLASGEHSFYCHIRLLWHAPLLACGHMQTRLDNESSCA